jgi:hypothetical protein
MPFIYIVLMVTGLLLSSVLPQAIALFKEPKFYEFCLGRGGVKDGYTTPQFTGVLCNDGTSISKSQPNP